MIKYNSLKTGDILKVKHNGKEFLVYYLEIFNENKSSLIVSKVKGKHKEILVINRDEVIKKYE